MAAQADLKRLREALELVAEAATTPSVDAASPAPDEASRGVELDPAPAVGETEPRARGLRPLVDRGHHGVAQRSAAPMAAHLDVELRGDPGDSPRRARPAKRAAGAPEL